MCDPGLENCRARDRVSTPKPRLSCGPSGHGGHSLLAGIGPGRKTAGQRARGDRRPGVSVDRLSRLPGIEGAVRPVVGGGDPHPPEDGRLRILHFR